MAKRAGKVYLVGAGPGAPDLITVRGAEVLARADAVVYDSLANPALLRLAPPSAELIFAGKRGGAEKTLEQAQLNALLIERARRGMTVARLKGGDPFVFGRGGEEAEALAAAAVEFEVVPGVTSAIAAPAFAGIPLTHREHASFVAFVAGHEDEGRSGAETGTPWSELARAAAGGRATLVLLMAAARLSELTNRLTAGGLPPETPAAAIQWGTTAEQKTVAATLGTLAAEAARERLGSPAVIVVGRCAGLRQRLGWAERMPLFGRRIVVTRAGEHAPAFARELRMLGAEAIELPVIETAPPESFQALDAALARLDSFDWMVFTSATGVERFIARMRELGRDIRAAGRAKIAAIGPATAARLRSYALTVAAMPAEYRAEALIGALGLDAIRGARFLIPRAQVARETLPASLHELGAAEVVVAPAYRTVRPSGPALERTLQTLKSGGFDLVAFTSSSTASNFAAMTGGTGAGIRAAAIGPITAETARALGFEVVASPSEYTVAALIEAIVEYFAPGQTATARPDKRPDLGVASEQDVRRR